LAASQGSTPKKAGAPLVKGRPTKAALTVMLIDGYTRVSLLEEADDLLIGNFELLHSRYS
jgi:hypothetical protein